MSTRMPDTVQAAWGEPAVRDFTAWLEGVMADGTVGRDEFGVLDTRLTVVEHDVADIKVEQRELRREMNLRFDRVNERFDRMSTEANERFDQMRTEVGARFDRANMQVDQRFDRMDERLDRMHTEMDARFDQLGERMAAQMRWSVSILAIVATLVTVLVALGQMTP